jgi:hypothetical protein
MTRFTEILTDARNRGIKEVSVDSSIYCRPALSKFNADNGTRFSCRVARQVGRHIIIDLIQAEKDAVEID